MKRTHTCGELTKKHVGKKAVLNGWVASTRSHGKLLFLTLRDRYGKTQCVIDGSKNKQAFEKAREFRNEFVVAVQGKVKARPKEMVKKSMKTGEIELAVERVELLNPAVRMPVEIEGKLLATEETRLKYRFVDLRRAEMHRNLTLRHKIVKAMGDYFDKLGFLEIETPMLAKSTPEGARDYLVATRDRGKFFALPQSPQIYKQLLMVAGYDKYFQIVRCMRDEDLRADRQPEFTQLDVEMSFVDEEDIYREIEGCMKQVMRDAFGVTVKIPFPRISYNESMEMFGCDKPDTRFGMELVDIANEVKGSGFGIFENTLKEKRGAVKAICVPKAANFSNRDIKKLEELVKVHKAKGIMEIMVRDEIESPLLKFISRRVIENIVKKCGAKKGDMVLIVAGHYLIISAALAALRNYLARKLDLIPKGKYNFIWVTEFPFFEYNEETQSYQATHHPFTFPNLEDLPYLKSDPARVRSRAYDIVLNGVELGSGSIRIHTYEVQEKVFDALGLSKQEAETKFGFMMNAFKYGAPPHGGIALGLDRFVMVLTDNETIRDVIAFPKNKHGVAMMEDAPNTVKKEQLGELGLKLEK